MLRSLRSILALSLVLALPAPSAHAARYVKQPTATGSGGAVATVDLLASRAAIRVLKAGGNAVDGAIAAAAVLGVTEPFSCGIGGGGFMVIYRSDTGRVSTIDHREIAPSAMTPESFRENGQPLAFNDARYSGLSAGVPGTVEGWLKALDRHGSMPLKRLLRPAIRVSRNGFVVDQTFSAQVEGNRDYFDDISSTRALFLDPDGTSPDVGSVFRNPDLARTYERIAKLGRKGFYLGRVAQAMVAAVRQPPVLPDANHRWRPGVMSKRDVKAYSAPSRPPTHVDYRGFDVYSMGPPSSGGSTIGEALNILEGYNLAGMPREQALHYFLEASRYSFADRNAYLADSDYVPVPLQGLLSESYAAERRALITERAAQSPVPAGNPWPHQGQPGRRARQGSATLDHDGTTTHLTVSDRWGNVVSYTFTIESTGGNGIVVPGWGFLLNNELTDFNFDSTTHPNRVEGGKRPRSSMSPTIVLRGGKPFLALGSPGGATIITTVLQMLIYRIDFGMSLPDALAAPRLSQRNSAMTQAEPSFMGTPEQTALSARGHTFSSVPEIGAATAIEFLGGRRVLAAAEPTRRGGGSALVEGR